MKAQNLKESLDSLRADENNMAAIISSRTNFDTDKAAELFREARTKDANEALAAGIVHLVADVNIPAGSKILTLTVT